MDSSRVLVIQENIHVSFQMPHPRFLHAIDSSSPWFRFIFTLTITSKNALQLDHLPSNTSIEFRLND